MESEKIVGRGRKGDEAKKRAILECISNGIGYLKSVPILISQGFVDEEGNCTVNRGSFENYRKKFAELYQIRIICNKEEQDWAKDHEEEILTFIRVQMRLRK